MEGQFSLVYLVFNTIDNLTSQQAQVDCFSNAAAHLAPGGLFLVEVGVPDLQRLPPGERYRVFAASPDHWGIDEFDVESQAHDLASLPAESTVVGSSPRRPFATPGRPSWT